MDGVKQSKQAVAGDVLTSMSGFAPPLLLALGSRLVTLSPRLNMHTATTNVPGPQQPVQTLGRRMLESYPFVPVVGSIRIVVAIFSYDGGLYFGVTGDYDGAPDIDVLTAGIERHGRPARDRRPAGPAPARAREASRTPRRNGLSAVTLSVSRIPDPAEPVPRVSIPALLLLVGGLALWWGSTIGYIEGLWPWPLATVLNAIASYLLFTVAHDASHRSLSSSERVNTWMGRVATVFFAPHAGFRTWRFIHMQHHRFTNHHDGSDPDDYTASRGPAWQAPLRWGTVDLWYMVFYLPRVRARPHGERIEFGNHVDSLPQYLRSVPRFRHRQWD